MQSVNAKQVNKISSNDPHLIDLSYVAAYGIDTKSAHLTIPRKIQMV